MRLIDADAASREIKRRLSGVIWRGDGLIPLMKDTANHYEFLRGYEEGAKYIANIVLNKKNIVDAEPVKHGRWGRSGPLLECNQCGEIYSQLGGNGGKSWNYCPNCGAKMDGESDDNKEPSAMDCWHLIAPLIPAKDDFSDYV